MERPIIREVANTLKSQYYATNDDWLKDCINYYLSEHNNPEQAEVLGFVISQWKLSNLRDISNEKPCLPTNLAREKCTTLQGHYMLQMEKVYDISESKFKQLEKIRNMSNENIEVTEAERTQAFFEPKKKRMLRLHLTDGVQDVIAIEYKPIRFLNDGLLPGYKFLIKGPVTCRRGIIMLDETCIKEIGGEVDNLLIPNALENVLARALNLPENPDPYSSNEAAVEQEDLLFEDDFDIDMAEQLESNNFERIVSDNSVSREQQNAPQSVNSTNRVQPKNTSQIPTNPVSREQQNASQSVISTNRVQPKNIPQIPPNPVSQRPKNARENLESKQTPPAVSRTESDILFEEMDDFIFDDDEVIECVSNLEFISAVSSKVNSPSKRPNDRKDSKTANPVENEKSSSVPIKNSFTVTSAESTTKKIEADFISGVGVTSSNCSATSKLSNLHINNESRDKQTATSSNKRTSAALSPIKNISEPLEKMHRANPKSVQKPATTTNKKITDYLKKSTVSPTKVPTQKSYDTVSDLLACNATETICKTVKAKITKIDKLSKKDQCWQLNATIADSTGSIDTSFSSEVLESILGFSVAEFSEKKKLKKKDPSIENYLRQGFRNAEQKLGKLHAPMEIELSPNKMPKIIGIKE